MRRRWSRPPPAFRRRHPRSGRSECGHPSGPRVQSNTRPPKPVLPSPARRPSSFPQSSRCDGKQNAQTRRRSEYQGSWPPLTSSCAVERTPERDQHIGLAGAQPNVAHHDVVQFHCFRAADRARCRGRRSQAAVIFTSQRRSASATPDAVLFPICTRTRSPGSDQPQMVSTLPRCRTMSSPKSGLTNGKGLRAGGAGNGPCAKALQPCENRRTRSSGYKKNVSGIHGFEPPLISQPPGAMRQESTPIQLHAGWSIPRSALSSA